MQMQMPDPVPPTTPSIPPELPVPGPDEVPPPGETPPPQEQPPPLNRESLGSSFATEAFRCSRHGGLLHRSTG